ncbi:hypothetical protein GCM10010507_59600 [Streptomyces cinnamoneus]|uniref:Uncharacterized protein n=1 Tax=Streptomyces cinnamoneus TaxID=53446 RepID=A0A918WQ09_STRCJ|nr:hypothetical protein GCM10010507_59600 [Streptomyces cinnamoneus]
MIPGRATVRSSSPALTREERVGGTTGTARASGDSVEDMRAMLRDDHARTFVAAVTDRLAVASPVS